MSADQVERKLAAIFAADVEGYSRLMGIDEVTTLRNLTAHRAIMDGLISKHRGRIANTAGDSVLAEFASVIDAVECAIAIQTAILAENEQLQAEQELRFRVGVHVGDVLAKGGDLFGEGVNIAARLETLSEAGGICVSDDAYRQIRGKIAVQFSDMGEQRLKNISIPIRVHRVLTARKSGSLPTGGHITQIPEKPAVAVLPFNIMQRDEELEAFSDGLTEDIITSLSRISGLFVIARNSTFTYKGKTVEIKEVARDMGVRYVLEGSVRRGGARLRITAQLINAAGHHVWAEKYDRDADDFFSIQDEIAQTITAAVQTEIRLSEGAFAYNSNSTLNDFVNRAWNCMYRLTKGGFAEARSCINRAFEIGTDHPRLYQVAAAIEFQEFYLGYSIDPEQPKRSLSFALNAVSLNPLDEYAYWALGLANLLALQHERAIGALRRAIELNPNFSLGHGSLATILAWSGEPEESIRQNELALRLNPRDPSNFFRHFGIALAHFIAGRYDRAANSAKAVAGEKPDWHLAHAMLIAGLAHLDRMQEAGAALRTCLFSFPDLRVADFWWLPFRSPAALELLKEGLRKTGLPE